MKKVGVCTVTFIILIGFLGTCFANKAVAMQNEEKYQQEFIEIWDGIDENIKKDLNRENSIDESIIEEELMEVLRILQ